MNSAELNGVSVLSARAAEAPRVAQLLQVYLRELDELTSISTGADGHFSYPWLPRYWDTLGRHPYFVFCDGEVAGLALVREKGSVEVADWDFQLAEFFIVPGFRKRGLGAAAARLVMDRHVGLWEVSYDVRNVAARAFWKRVAAESESSSLPLSVSPDRERYLFRTHTPRERIRAHHTCGLDQGGLQLS